MPMAAAAAASTASIFSTVRATPGSEFSKQLSIPFSKSSAPPLIHLRRAKKVAGIFATAVSSKPREDQIRTNPSDLVDSILAKVTDTDRGVLLARDEQEKVAEVFQELRNYCVEEPVKCPLIFGEWDVVYCSTPTSPGGGYRSAIGRLFFKTKEMIQVVEAPDTVNNKVSFSLFGFLDGEVSLKGKLTALDEKWIKVVFEPPELKVGALDFQYGGQSEVQLEITYIDEKIRLGKGSRGSLFVFQRRGQAV